LVLNFLNIKEKDMTGKELFELSERFHTKCEETLNEGECTGCEFKGKESGVIFPCPEFYFKTEGQANDFLDFLGVGQSELITSELLECAPINNFSSSNFSGCEFHNCEIYINEMNN